MTRVLVRKLLRDVRLAWSVTALLLFLFQLLWARITQRVTELIAQFNLFGLSLETLEKMVMKDNDMPGKMVQSIIGGENIQLNHPVDMMSISYVHPLVLTILGLWAISRAASAIAGEIDRGTMELLLAQPIRRTQIILAHLWVDALIFPPLVLLLWAGTFFGTWIMGLQTLAKESERIHPVHFLPALLSMLALLFAVSGLTMWLSSRGRSFVRVLGGGMTLFLVMFLVNILGQIWPDPLQWIGPFTIYYHYQPQGIILNQHWYHDSEVWQHLLVLMGIGVLGYFFAWVTFCRRDLPAPL